MTTVETNIGNALLAAKEIIAQMIAKGFGEAVWVYALSCSIAENFNLTRDQSIIIIEEALKLVEKQ